MVNIILRFSVKMSIETIKKKKKKNPVNTVQIDINDFTRSSYRTTIHCWVSSDVVGTPTSPENIHKRTRFTTLRGTEGEKKNKEKRN